MKLGKAILTHRHPILVDGKWEEEANIFEVRVMAIVEEYAMVRRKNAMPFVCNVKELKGEG